MEQPRKIRKGPKGPNPLSVKKKTVNVLPPSKKDSKKDSESKPKSYTNDVEAGMKRKRSLNDESIDDAPDGNAAGESIKKRRRKRKSRTEVITGAG